MKNNTTLEVIENNTIEDIISKIRQCDDYHDRCDYLLEHDELTYLLEYIDELHFFVKEIQNSLATFYEKTYGGLNYKEKIGGKSGE